VLLNDALIELGRLHIYSNSVYQFTRSVTLGAKSEDQLREMVPRANLNYEATPDKPQR
jgi:hypothetical protein